MSAVEIEVKFQVADAAQLHEQLIARGFREETPSTFERNVLFDTPDHSLRVKRTILRVRKYGERWVLTHKCLPDGYDPDERHKHRVETETAVADGEALGAIFRKLGYVESFVYEKWRTEYADATGHCVIDRTPIGVYAELEGPEGWIDSISQQLGVEADKLLTISYGRLFEQWQAETGSAAQNFTFEEVGGDGGIGQSSISPGSV